jgi:hypothetical protein
MKCSVIASWKVLCHVSIRKLCFSDITRLFQRQKSFSSVTFSKLLQQSSYLRHSHNPARVLFPSS